MFQVAPYSNGLPGDQPGVDGACAAAFLSEGSFHSRDSFSTRCRMIFPGLNFTVGRAGITKLLPGSFGFRPTRGFVNRGWKTPKFRNSTATLLARLSVM